MSGFITELLTLAVDQEAIQTPEKQLKHYLTNETASLRFCFSSLDRLFSASHITLNFPR